LADLITSKQALTPKEPYASSSWRRTKQYCDIMSYGAELDETLVKLNNRCEERIEKIQNLQRDIFSKEQEYESLNQSSIRKSELSKISLEVMNKKHLIGEILLLDLLYIIYSRK
jgi:NAD kinase